MKNRLIIFSLILMVSLFLAADVTSAQYLPGAQSTMSINETDMMIGLDLPTIGWATSNAAGEITGYRGANLAIGYSEKRYFEPLRYMDLNPYWGFGTVALISPYAQIGFDYPFARMDDGSFFAVGAHIGFALNLARQLGIDIGIGSDAYPLGMLSVSYRF